MEKSMKIDQIDQDRAGGGNTGTPPAEKKKQQSQYTYWCFTFNNYEIDQIDQIEQLFKHECKWYIFQEEIGEKNTPHLQGIICLKEKQRLTQLLKINPKIHWEPTKSVSASKVYCSKKETNNGNIYAWGIEIPNKLDIDEPYGWQLKVIDIIKQKPDKRSIYWFYDKKGNMGKTSLCKYLCVNHNALMLTGKSNDMYHMLSKFPNKRNLILVDIPRSSQDFINYGAIEQIKNGLVFSGKYEGCQLIFNCPHVICFSNEKPDLNKMSKDRWKITRIDEDPCYDSD